MASLPFALDPESVSRWLSGLDHTGVRHRARSLYQAVKGLNGVPGLDEPLRFSLLEALRQPVFAASELLAREFLRASAWWEESPRNTAKLSAFLHHELAAGYESLSGPVAGQRTIASLGRMILRVLQIGEPVSSGVWRRLYRCYSDAGRQGWETQPVEEPLLRRRVSPLQQFQWVLAFVALTPTRFDPAAMEEIFALLQSGVIEVQFGVSSAGWCFDPDSPRGPRRAERASLQPETVQYLGMSLSGRPDSVDGALRFRLRHHMGHPAEEGYPVERQVDELWLGWKTIVGELSRRQSLQADMGWLEVPEFELLVPDAPGSGNESGTDRIHRHVSALLKQSRDQCQALLQTDIALSGGELMILRFLDGGLRLALVRWAHPGWFGNPGHFGLDLFAGRPASVKAIVPKLGPNDAILVSQDREGDILLLPPVKLKPGMEVLIDAAEARIARLLEWTEDFCAYRLVP